MCKVVFFSDANQLFFAVLDNVAAFVVAKVP